jgi:hypothetical protein
MAKAETAPMAGPWLYPISAGADRSFVLADGQSVPVSVDSYRTLLGNGRINEDLYWYISQNWNNVEIGDEVFIYTGDGELGIIGYATIAGVEQRADRWCILPRFDMGRSRDLLDNPIPAAVVRAWVRFPRKSVINFAPFQEQLRARLPWAYRDAVTDSVLPEEIVQPGGAENFKTGVINETFDTFMLRLTLARGKIHKTLKAKVIDLWDEMEADNRSYLRGLHKADISNLMEA